MHCAIIGTNYCGSTMLSYMLGSSSKVFSTGELTHGNERLTCGDWHKGTPCKFWTDDFKKFLIKNKKHKYKILEDRAARVFGSKILLTPDKYAVFYDKSIKNGDKLDYAIILFKNPYAFSYSFIEHQKKRYGMRFGEKVRRQKMAEKACSFYFSEYTAAENLVKNKGIPHIYVSYEKLAKNPSAILKKVCQKLKIPFEKKMIEYWNNSNELHLVPSGNAGARYQFLDEKKYKRIWNSRLDGHNDAYGKEHSSWLLDNYRKITLDQKWKKYLKSDEKSIIENHKKSQILYNEMMKKSL